MNVHRRKPGCFGDGSLPSDPSQPEALVKHQDVGINEMTSLMWNAMTKVRLNAEADPTYCPWCLRCKGLVRMNKVEPFLWSCDCGAKHDERDPNRLAPKHGRCECGGRLHSTVSCSNCCVDDPTDVEEREAIDFTNDVETAMMMVDPHCCDGQATGVTDNTDPLNK